MPLAAARVTHLEGEPLHAGERPILVEKARAKKAEKRGGQAVKPPLEDVHVAAEQKDGELLALEEALQTLEALDPQQARIVELRYFAGLTMEELALKQVFV